MLPPSRSSTPGETPFEVGPERGGAGLPAGHGYPHPPGPGLRWTATGTPPIVDQAARRSALARPAAALGQEVRVEGRSHVVIGVASGVITLGALARRLIPYLYLPDVEPRRAGRRACSCAPAGRAAPDAGRVAARGRRRGPGGPRGPGLDAGGPHGHDATSASGCWPRPSQFAAASALAARRHRPVRPDGLPGLAAHAGDRDPHGAGRAGRARWQRWTLRWALDRHERRAWPPAGSRPGRRRASWRVSSSGCPRRPQRRSPPPAWSCAAVPVAASLLPAWRAARDSSPPSPCGTTRRSAHHPAQLAAARAR